jgi:hypothetical protein
MERTKATDAPPNQGQELLISVHGTQEKRAGQKREPKSFML